MTHTRSGWKGGRKRHRPEGDGTGLAQARRFRARPTEPAPAPMPRATRSAGEPRPDAIARPALASVAAGRHKAALKNPTRSSRGGTWPNASASMRRLGMSFCAPSAHRVTKLARCHGWHGPWSVGGSGAAAAAADVAGRNELKAEGALPRSRPTFSSCIAHRRRASEAAQFHHGRRTALRHRRRAELAAIILKLCGRLGALLRL